jgi:ferrous iron transport protein B
LFVATLALDPRIEAAVERLAELLADSYPLNRRALAILLLEGDEEMTRLVAQRQPENNATVKGIVQSAQKQFNDPLAYVIHRNRMDHAHTVVEHALQTQSTTAVDWGEKLSRWMIRPFSGGLILILVLLALYWWVGVIGAQVMVDWLESVVFEGTFNPWITNLVTSIIPQDTLSSLFIGEFGVFTLGLRYAVAIILPVVGTFFFAFAIIEDSGYLPRLALLIDWIFKRIGLNGRAVIPMVLGFGCDTMATVVTRTLETTRERVITTMLLALAIPCSAQLGVIFAILARYPGALLVWSGVVAGVLVLVGFLAAQVLPGEKPSFYIEVPPLRLPRLSNVFIKTYSRMEWYFREILPVFLIASLLIWLGNLTGLFQHLVDGIEPVLGWLGLPSEAAVAFIFGFFRRDYGAAGLYDVQGVMTGAQLVVASVTLTLFVPCVAQFVVMFKERGWRWTLGVVAFIFPFAFIIGWLLNSALAWLGWLQ